MSICQQATRRRCQRRNMRPRGLRATSRTVQNLVGFGAKISKTAKKSGAR